MIELGMPVSSQTPIPDETEVLSLAREGDVKAFSELVRRYEGKIFRLALHITATAKTPKMCCRRPF